MNFFRNIYHWVASVIHHMGRNTEAPNPPAETPGPIMTMPEPSTAGDTITLIADKYCTPEEAANIPNIVKAIYEGMLHPKFKEFLCDPKNGLDLNQINGLTPEQFVEVVRTTKVTATITYYYAWTSTIGYRNEGESIIHCNRRFHDSYTVEEEASNVLHECTHLMGFDHDFRATARRPFSGPYMVNKALEYAFTFIKK